MKKVFVVLMAMLCLSAAAQAASVTHCWNFEGADDAERMQDKVGSLDLSHPDDQAVLKATFANNAMVIQEEGYGIEAASFGATDLDFGTDSFSYSFRIKCYSDASTGKQFRVMDGKTSNTAGGIYAAGGKTDFSAIHISPNDTGRSVGRISTLFDEDVYLSVVVNVDRSGATPICEIYVDGSLESFVAVDTLPAGDVLKASRFQLGYAAGGGGENARPGEMDYFAFYDDILSADQIAGLNEGILSPMLTTVASAPVPANGAIDIATNVTLGWTTAADPNNLTQPNSAVKKHYLYADFDNVAGDPNLYLVDVIDLGTNTYGPLSLENNTTYYWYIEEALDNGAGGYYPAGDPNNSIGSVWEFTTEGSMLVQYDFDGSLAPAAGSAADAPTGQGKTVAGLPEPNSLQATDITMSYVTGADGTPNGAVQIDPNQYVDFGVEGYPKAGSLAGGFGGGMDTGTIVYWVKPESAGFVYANFNSPSGTTGFQTRVYPSTTGSDYPNIYVRAEKVDEATRYFSSGGRHARSDWSIYDGEWHMVAVTWEMGVNTRFYVDGENVYDAGITLSPEEFLPWQRGVLLGAYRDADGILWDMLNGAVDNLRVYNYRLDDSDSAVFAREYYDVTGTAPCQNSDFSAFNYDNTGSSYCQVDLADFAVFALEWMTNGFWEFE